MQLLIAKPVWVFFHNVVVALCCSRVVVVLLDSQRVSTKRDNFHDFSLNSELNIRGTWYTQQLCLE